MKKLFVTAAAAMTLFAAAPALADSPSEQTKQDLSPYPSAGSCRVIWDPVILRDGSIGFTEQQVCG